MEETLDLLPELEPLHAGVQLVPDFTIDEVAIECTIHIGREMWQEIKGLHVAMEEAIGTTTPMQISITRDSQLRLLATPTRFDADADNVACACNLFGRADLLDRKHADKTVRQMFQEMFAHGGDMAVGARHVVLVNRRGFLGRRLDLPRIMRERKHAAIPSARNITSVQYSVAYPTTHGTDTLSVVLHRDGSFTVWDYPECTRFAYVQNALFDAMEGMYL